MSRLYDALRKVEEENREQVREPVREPAPGTSKTLVAQPRHVDQLLSAPVLAARFGSASRIVVSSDPRSPGSERFRLIRMAIRNACAGKLPKVMLITSPLPKDGKSTVALNLASSLAEAGKYKVLLIEGDLHRPSLLENLGLGAMPGIAEVLQESADPFSLIHKIDPLDFYLLPAGHAVEHPAEMFQGERFHGLLQSLRSCFDCIVIDCPPAFPLADVVALKAHADGVLLVARAGATPREAVAEAIGLFKPGQILGMVLNAEEEVNQIYANYYYRKDRAVPGTQRATARAERPWNANE